MRSTRTEGQPRAGVARVAAMVCLLALAAGVAGADGTAGLIDTGFGTNGLVFADPRLPSAVAVQSDGDILVVGQTQSGIIVKGSESTRWTVRRYVSDGLVDPSFGTAGVVHYGGLGPSDRPKHMAVDSLGRIVIGGNGSIEVVSGKGKKRTVGRQGGGMVIRLTSNGDLDQTFGDGGEVFLGAEALSGVEALVVLPDDSIVAAGECERSLSSSGRKGKKGGGGGNLTTALYLAAITEGGDLDASFGTDGVTVHNLVNGAILSDERVVDHGLARQSDGGLVVAMSNSESTSRWSLLRFSASGLHDSAFGTLVVADAGLHAIAVDGADRIYAAGYDRVDGDFLLRRYDANGDDDPTFGVAGEVRLDATSVWRFQAGPGAIHLDGAGIVVGGLVIEESGPAYDMGALRFEADGDLDATYGASGHSQTVDEAVGSYAALTASGDLVLLGYEYVTGGAWPAWITTLVCRD